MKKKLSWLLAVTLLVTLLVPVGAFARQSLKAKVNDELLTFDKSIFTANGKIMVPLKGLFEKLGAQTRFEEKTGKIFIEDKYTTVEMTLNKKQALVHRKFDFSGIPEKVELKTAPKKVKNTVYIPLSFTVEALGATIKWDGKTRTAIITTKDRPAPVDKALDYKVLTREDIAKSKELLKWYEENHKRKGIHRRIVGSATFILVSGGEKPTGGYTLDIDSVILTTEGKISVTAHVRKPSPDMMVTQALTYPHKLLRLDNVKNNRVEGTIDVYNYAMTEKDLAYKVLAEKDIKSGSDLAKWVETNRMNKGIHYTKVNNVMYVLVSGGERNTGGYTVEVQNVVSRKPDEAFVYAHVNHPPKDSIVTQVITYPFALIEIDGSTIKHAGGDIKEIEG